jgi:hypothetical protein
MDELERVIYDLERCTCHVPDACSDCSKYGSETGLKCMENLMMDALGLLKEQEPVEPHDEHASDDDSWYYGCGACHKAIDYKDRFCRHCGRAVKWNG